MDRLSQKSVFRIDTVTGQTSIFSRLTDGKFDEHWRAVPEKSSKESTTGALIRRRRRIPAVEA